jgi:hypothetical protein
LGFVFELFGVQIFSSPGGPHKRVGSVEEVPNEYLAVPQGVCP